MEPSLAGFVNVLSSVDQNSAEKRVLAHNCQAVLLAAIGPRLGECGSTNNADFEPVDPPPPISQGLRNGFWSNFEARAEAAGYGNADSPSAP
jgi:hypothetical protein